MDLSTFLRNGIPISSIELIAALAGTYYLRTTQYDKMTKQLVIFLWFTFLTELLAWYAPLSHFSDYKFLGFVKDTPFKANYWIYNIYLIISFSFYVHFFNSYLRDRKWNVLLNWMNVVYVISAILYLLITDTFFKSFSMFTNIAGTLLLFIAIILLFYQVLRSDLLLKLKHWLPLYVAIGVLIFNACITPIDIFSIYFKAENNVFVTFRADIDLIAITFLYLTFTIGFLICSRKK